MVYPLSIPIMSVQQELLTGTLLQGKQHTYRIVKVLGQGSFGITYLATIQCNDTTRQVAVKEFYMRDINKREGDSVSGGSQSALFERYKRKFLKESINIGRLNHSNIVKVLESFECNNTAYYTMEYCEGGNLNDYINTLPEGKLSEECAINYFLQLASAVEYMHHHKMLHLDIKPANVMLRNNSEAVLIDFGLSKQYDENGHPESTTTIGGGTPGYAPIEQIDYQEGDGFPVTMDVYALGATLYKMLSGERPPKASDLHNGTFPSHVLRNKGVSEKYIQAIKVAMESRLSQRFPTVAAFVAVIKGEAQCSDYFPQDATLPDDSTAAGKEPVAHDGKGHDGGTHTRKSHRKWLLAVVAMALLVVGVIGFFVRNNNTSHPLEEAAPQEIGNHTYVDLGLPSGILWATCNVGATQPEESGNHYAWGETITKIDYDETEWSVDTSAMCNISGNEKYDAARAYWGYTWRMPTRAEWRELMHYCKWERIVVNGVYGMKAIGPNGNSIFLPATGAKIGSEHINKDSLGAYWSATSGNEENSLLISPYIDCYLFTPEKSYTFMAKYSCGYAIRPVSDKIAPDAPQGNPPRLDENSQSHETTTGTQAITSDSIGYENGYMWIDMGLPSGTKWASHNMGAKSSSGHGYYYEWGETWVGKHDDDSCATYNIEMNDISGNAQYDAARAQWGGCWRMPTIAQWEELADECIWIWEKINNVAGYKVISRVNNNEIFIPAAGEYYYGQKFDVGTGGVYWSSTPGDGLYYNEYAQCFIFDKRTRDVVNEFRFSGIPIRPVCSPL